MSDSPYPSPSTTPYSTPNISPFTEKFSVSVNVNGSSNSSDGGGYGAVDDYDEEYDDDQIEEFGRKWSIFEKLERKNYWHFYTCFDYFRAFNFKCLLATLMLALFILFVLTFYNTIFINSDANPPMSFDFIIIGGGPSGSVVTRSLVDAGASVLLLEAGSATQYGIGGDDVFGGPVTRFDVPLLWTSITKDYYWPDLKLPQALLAKALGGCGILNGMVYVRALPYDIKRWGIHGWTWDLLLDKYREMEHYVHDTNSNDTSNDITTNLSLGNYHGTGGPITTSRPAYVDEVGPKFVSSAVQHGVDFNSDFNQPNKREGVGYYDFNIANGIRDSAATAMLHPILDKSNLMILLEAVVQRIILNPIPITDKKSTSDTKSKNGINYSAVGVEFTQNGIKKTAYLKTSHIPIKDIPFSSERSIILTAGAIMTPKILMVSGIGPADHLELKQIDVKVNASDVGANLQDHPSLGMIFDIVPDTSSSSSLPSIYSIGKLWTNYIDAVEEKGPAESYGILGSPGLSSGAFLKSIYATDDVPDIQLTVYPTVSEPHLIDRYERAKGTKANRSFDIRDNKILITVTLLRPEAKYRVLLNDDKPYDMKPDIVLPPNRDHYLTDSDIRRLKWGISQVRNIVSAPPLSQMILGETSPAIVNIDDDTMTTWINDNIYPSSHWSGTASMGKVVDESLKVKHVQGLRIADASVIPVITNGPIHATVVAIASLCADIIQGKKLMKT